MSSQEATDPRHESGKYFALLGCGVTVLGLVLLVVARGGLTDANGIGLVVGAFLVLNGLVAAVMGWLWRGQLELLTSDPLNLVNRKDVNQPAPDSSDGGAYTPAELKELLAKRSLPVGRPGGLLGRLLLDRLPLLKWAPARVRALSEALLEAWFNTALILVAGGVFASGLSQASAVTPRDALWAMFAGLMAVWGIGPLSALKRSPDKTPRPWAFRITLALAAAVVVPPLLGNLAGFERRPDAPWTEPLVWLLAELTLLAATTWICLLQLRDLLAGLHVEASPSCESTVIQARIMPQQIYETLHGIMSKRSPNRLPNRVYRKAEPAEEAKGIAANSDMRGNFDIELLQETQPVLADSTNGLGGPIRTGFIAFLAMISLAVLWAFGAAIFGSHTSVAAVRLCLLPPILLYQAGCLLGSTFYLMRSQVKFESLLMHFQARGTFEATIAREVSIGMRPTAMAARITSYSYLTAWSRRPSQTRHLLSMSAAPQVVEELTRGLGQSLGEQMFGKELQQRATDHFADAVVKNGLEHGSTDLLLQYLPDAMKRKLPNT